MADTTNKASTVLEFKVDYDKAYNDIAELNIKLDEQKQKVKDLNEEYKDQGKTREYYKELAKIKEQTKDYNDQLKSLTKSIENEKKANDLKQGSLVSLRAQLSNLTKAYDQLSETERKEGEGKELQKKISEVYNELKRAEEATGRFQRNVGNYSQQMVTAFGNAGGAVGSMINPIKNVTMGFKAMSSTPIIAILGLLINIVNKVIESMKGNEEALNRVRSAMAPLNALSTLFQKTLEVLANGIARVVEKLGKWLGSLKILKSEMQEEQQITKDEIALNERRRQVAEQNAKTDQEVADLKAKAAQKDKLTATQQIALWEEIGEKEKEAARRNRDLAAEELRVAQARADLTANSEEENNRLSQLRVAAINAETAYLGKVREVNSQLASIRKKEAKEVKAEAAETAREEAKEFKDRKKLLEDDIKDRLAVAKKGSEEELALKREQLAQALALAEEEISKSEAAEETKQQRLKSLRAKYAQDEQQLELEKTAAIESLTRQHLENLANEQVEGTRERLEAELNVLKYELDNMHQGITESDEAFKERQIAAQLKYNERKKQINDAEVEMERAKVSAIGSAMGALSNLIAEAGEENEAMAKLSKTIALAQILIESGVATAKGINQAQSVPFPANIGAIATTIATILSGITSAISTVKSAKFATGGYVSGPGSATSDSIPARLSNGEYVVNASGTSMFGPLLAAINASGRSVPSGDQSAGFSMLAGAVAAGMKSVDLRVGVDEVTTVQQRVDRIQTVAEV